MKCVGKYVVSIDDRSVIGAGTALYGGNFSDKGLEWDMAYGEEDKWYGDLIDLIIRITPQQ